MGNIIPENREKVNRALVELSLFERALVLAYREGNARVFSWLFARRLRSPRLGYHLAEAVQHQLTW